MRKLLTLLLVFHTFLSLSGQTKERDSILQIAEKYRSVSGAKELNNIVTKAQKGLIVKNTKDSLYAANLFLLEAESLFYSWDIPVLREKFNSAINMSPSTDEGQILKVETIISSTYMEVPIGFEMSAYTKTKEALSILENLKSEPPTDLLLSIYESLMILNSTFGDTKKQKEYRDKANKLFEKNNFDSSRMVAFYTANIMSLYETDTNESTILYYINKIRKFPNKIELPNFKYVDISASNRLTKYYYNTYKRGDKTALKKGYDIIAQTLQKYSKDKSMSYHIKEAMHLKCEFLIAENKFEDAFKINSKLISISKKNDRRFHFNLAQRMIILLGLDKVADAKELVFDTLDEFHTGQDELKNDYSNFSTRNIVDYTSLFLDISDAFNKHKKNDADVKKLVNTWNNISLNQFQKSIDNKLTTKKTKALFKRVISNLLTAHANEDDQQFYVSQLLETIENIENTIEWQEFLQQRNYSKLNVVNDFKFEEYAITNALIEARIKEEDSTISTLELQLEQLKTNFKSKNPNIIKYSFSDFKTSDFKQSLLNDEVTLRYETIKDSLYTFVISKNNIELKNLGSSKAILDLTKSYLNDIKNRIDATLKAKELYALLIPNQVEKFKHLNILPDDYLYKLPFETLINSNNNYLIENKTVLYAPYLALLKYSIKNDSLVTENNTKLMIFTPAYETAADETTDVVVRGNSYRLDGAEKESKLISELFPNTSFSDYSATKENFRRYAPDGQLLHLSMHASLNSTTPQLSHLIFTEGNTDNKLYLEELYGMNLKADMAVLSACNTGVGEFELDKGIVSLHRAFTQAGVPTTVSSLWSAPDNATQKIMVAFYKELKLGKTKAEALQLAKLNYLKTTDNPMLKTSFYWAGFVINGDNKAIMLPNSEINYWLWIALGIAAALVIILLYFRKK
ncbi:CHAT domain-containing protein [Winogradskyella bathintestinalis]|uniref:CHAT domain-containing protein n=1 Tax=Winogradskyella bathintestinalis TaxID=3035208 RepID=A0ABT7ZSB9_9FLAO|nr:CHAT domain-containing protein [Winogradskyella bathintestinalis]MDN3491911.1 CHAT domain-containing protein [Winogradskyella bathintestinalis]